MLVLCALLKFFFCCKRDVLCSFYFLFCWTTIARIPKQLKNLRPRVKSSPWHLRVSRMLLEYRDRPWRAHQLPHWTDSPSWVHRDRRSMLVVHNASDQVLYLSKKGSIKGFTCNPIFSRNVMLYLYHHRRHWENLCWEPDLLVSVSIGSCCTVSRTSRLLLDNRSVLTAILALHLLQAWPAIDPILKQTKVICLFAITRLCLTFHVVYNPTTKRFEHRYLSLNYFAQLATLFPEAHNDVAASVKQMSRRRNAAGSNLVVSRKHKDYWSFNSSAWQPIDSTFVLSRKQTFENSHT